MQHVVSALVGFLAPTLFHTGTSYALRGVLGPPTGNIIRTRVYPKIIQQRSLSAELTLMINDDLVLDLEKISILSNDFQVTTYSDVYKIIEQVKGAQLQRKLYHDPKREAALVVESTNDGIRVEGILGDTLRVRPSLTTERNLEGQVAHEIFEIPIQNTEYENPGGDSSYAVRYLNEEFKPRAAVKGLKKKEMLNITPEVHIIVDSYHACQFDSRNATIDYIAVFFAFVNMKFKTLKSNLDVQLVLSQLTIFRSGNESFLQKPEDHQDVMLASTLETFRYFIGNNSKDFENDDFVVLLTGCDVAFMDSEQKLNLGVTGYAYIGGACSAFKVAIVEDMHKMFEGVHPFAHEVGHLLGMVHDEEGAPSELPGSPGSKSCFARAGNIMSPAQTAQSNHKFSTCSAEQLRAFATSGRGNCFENRPTRHITNLHVNKITNEQVSPEEFCKRKNPYLPGVRYQKETYHNGQTFSIKNCEIVCLNKDTREFTVHDAPDTTPCDEKNKLKMCLNKECKIPKNMTTFPKRTYYRKE